jgi:hypothetical protein
MFWSDETHSCCKGQQLRQNRTNDGVTWTDEKITVAEGGGRPGMIIVRKNPVTNRYFMTYEYCGVARKCAAYYRMSGDGWNFGPPTNPGTLIRTAQGDVFEHAPANAWSPSRRHPAGTWIVVGQTVVGPNAPALNGQVLLINNDPDGAGPWLPVRAPVTIPTANGQQPCVNYSSALLPAVDGLSILELAGAFPESGPCSMYFASEGLTDNRSR